MPLPSQPCKVVSRWDCDVSRHLGKPEVRKPALSNWGNIWGNYFLLTFALSFRSPAHVFTRLEMFVWYMTKPEKLKTLKPLNRFWRLKNGYFKLPQGSKITYPLVKKRRYAIVLRTKRFKLMWGRNLNGIQSCRLFGAWPWWHVRQRVYLNGAPSVTQMLRDVHCWKLYSYKSPIWHYLPGPSFLWDDARIKQLRLFETALQHFDGPIMDTFRLLVGDFTPAELVNKREPWLELQVLNLFEWEAYVISASSSTI